VPHVLASVEATELGCEVIVVDNCPSDASTYDLISRLPCRYELAQQKGLGHARNVGVDASRAEIVLFVDDDVEVPANWVEAMSRQILDGNCDLVAGTVRPGVGRLREWMGESIRATVGALIETEDGKPTHLVGASFGLHRRVHDAVRFDPLLGAGTPYGSGEDVLFAMQATETGFTIHGCNRAPVLHNFDVSRLNREELRKRARAVGRSEAYLSVKVKDRIPRYLWLRVIREMLRLQANKYRRWRQGIVMTDAEFRSAWALARKRQLVREVARAR
jgi:glycosyltransferase involved in cell wall biosynthesis